VLRVGPLIISEFTISAKYELGRPIGTTRPGSAERDYSRYDLTGSCMAFPMNPYRGKGGSPDGSGLSHINSQQGYWQGSVAALIERHTGIRITALDWYPR